MLTMGKMRQNLTVVYPFGGPRRALVPEDKINWEVHYPEYAPPSFTTDSVKTKSWADPLTMKMSVAKWNSMDGLINRTSHMGEYRVSRGDYPLNPVGRTGITDRGNLGRWGPNHAADPIVTRWRRDKLQKIILGDNTGKTQLQFLAIKRQDTGEWAIPGGMVDPGEDYLVTLKREFMEETLNIDEATAAEVAELDSILGELFKNGVEIYKGYVDDHRNTDNAWIETHAVNFHLENDDIFSKITLKPGSDAARVRWIDIDETLNLYASHKSYIKATVDYHCAHW